MFIDLWMKKQNVVYPYNGRLLGNKNEWSGDIWYKMDEPWKHYAKWKKPVTCDSIHMKPPEQAKLVEMKNRLMVARG